MISLLLLFIPFVGSLIALLLKNGASRVFAMTWSLVSLTVALYAWLQFSGGSDFDFSVNIEWVKSLGINFHIGMDGISLLMVLLTNILIPIIVLTTWKHPYRSENIFYALVLLMQVGLTGVFISLDAFLFYVAWELALIPIYFICALWGGENRIKVTLKFFIYTILGSLFMLSGIIFLYTRSSIPSFDIYTFYSLTLNPVAQVTVFVTFFLAFAIKMPIFPFHTWQPNTYTEAPAQGTMLLSGIMLKMGVYGVIRWIMPIAPLAFSKYGGIIILLSLVGIVHGSIVAFTQRDLKRLVAYSSLAHVGLICAALFTLNIFGLQGALIQMLSHGVNVVGLFFVISLIQEQTGTRKIDDLGGIAAKAPVLATCFGIIMFGSIALPLTNGFVGEFLMLNGLFLYNPWACLIAGLAVIFGAVYMLRMFQQVMLGKSNTVTENFSDVQGTDRLALFILVALVLLFGIYPNGVLSLTEPVSKNILLQLGYYTTDLFWRQLIYFLANHVRTHNNLLFRHFSSLHGAMESYTAFLAPYHLFGTCNCSGIYSLFLE